MNSYLMGCDVLGADLTEQEKKAADTIVFATRAGAVAGLVGGALLWTSHRVIGALLGGLIVGPAAGAVLGIAATAHTLRQLRERNA